MSDPRVGALGRVPDELGTPLTQQEVDALPDDTEVVIVWSGGNGPHCYSIWRDAHGTPYARSEHDDVEDMPRLAGWRDPITFVGDQRFHTRVWRAVSGEPKPEPDGVIGPDEVAQ